MDKKQIEAALGKISLDVLIQNVQLVNVFTREIYPSDIGISGGYIVSVAAPGSFPGKAKTVVDGKNKYAIPGLIDSHIHIESSMMTPAGYAAAVLPHGTTTIVTDPHEIGNVMGLRGVRYMLDATENLPLRVFVQSPSCVPAVPGMETAGAAFNAPEIDEMLGWDRVIGLAEVMDYIGVIQQNERMSAILQTAREQNTVISGHCPSLRGPGLAAYMVGGVLSDHEGIDEEELYEKFRLGMYVEGRASSFSESMTVLGRVIKRLGSVPLDLVLCTDDVYPDDLRDLGVVDHVIRYGIKAGIPAIDLVRAATLVAAGRHRLHDLGAIAPGKRADIVLLNDLDRFEVDEVFSGGELVAKAGAMTVSLTPMKSDIELENTVHLSAPVSAADFIFKARPGKKQERIRVMAIDEHLRRSLEEITFPVRDGAVEIPAGEDICLVNILERHGKNGNRFMALVKGLGIKEGAVATTVAHDSHNLVVAGRNPEDMALAALELVKCGGGMSCVKNGKVLAVLPLPVAGLMSPAPLNEVAAGLDKLNQAMRGLGIAQRQPLAGLISLALPVIPDYGLTDMGLVDVEKQVFIPVFCEE